ncbi:MAG: pseudouridine synthase [Pseudoxanthomonas sp.]
MASRHERRSRCDPDKATRHGLARAISKAGVCSRSEAARRVAAGRVQVDGRVVTDPEFPTVTGRSQVVLDGRALPSVRRMYLALNKPHGLVTSARDERGRETVYACLREGGLPWVAPVGRLDKASEGLLLLSNDPEWAARITDPELGPDKTYHVQVAARVGAPLLAALERGVDAGGERLAARHVRLLRQGGKNAWLEIVLDEGRNRHIRRLLAAHDIDVLRLVRVAIGDLRLGDLAKGQWRELSAAEVAMLA